MIRKKYDSETKSYKTTHYRVRKKYDFFYACAHCGMTWARSAMVKSADTGLVYCGFCAEMPAVMFGFEDIGLFCAFQDLKRAVWKLVDALGVKK